VASGSSASRRDIAGSVLALKGDEAGEAAEECAAVGASLRGANNKALAARFLAGG
jgi:hypothetical protein